MGAGLCSRTQGQVMGPKGSHPSLQLCTGTESLSLSSFQGSLLGFPWSKTPHSLLAEVPLRSLQPLSSIPFPLWKDSGPHQLHRAAPLPLLSLLSASVSRSDRSQPTGTQPHLLPPRPLGALFWTKAWLFQAPSESHTHPPSELWKDPEAYPMPIPLKLKKLRFSLSLA